MNEYSGLNSWIAIINQKLPHLSRPQAKVLAMWSFGIGMMQSTGLTTVAVFLAQLLGEKENTVRQRLREWLRDADDKKGTQRQQIDVSKCFAPLLGWVVDKWHSTESQRFRRGFIQIIVALLLGQPLPIGRFFPESWRSPTAFSSA